MATKIGESSLTITTRQLVKDRPSSLSLKQLATDCEVSIYWLSLFANGKIPEPGAGKVQRLYERLTGRNLISAQ